MDYSIYFRSQGTIPKYIPSDRLQQCDLVFYFKFVLREIWRILKEICNIIY
jgi:hypothetical protein